MFGKPSVTNDYVHVYSQDPALDTAHEDFDHAQWLTTGDEKFHPVLGESAPVKFHLRHLSFREEALVADTGVKRGGVSSMTLALSLALKKIDPFLDGDGKPVEWKRSPTMDGLLIVPDDVLRLVRDVDDGELFHELAMRVLDEMNGNPTQSRRSK